MNADSMNFCAHMDNFVSTHDEFYKTLVLINKKIATDSQELARSVFDASTCYKHISNMYKTVNNSNMIELNRCLGDLMTNWGNSLVQQATLVNEQMANYMKYH
jgi:hypothetical protein